MGSGINRGAHCFLLCIAAPTHRQQVRTSTSTEGYPRALTLNRDVCTWAKGLGDWSHILFVRAAPSSFQGARVTIAIQVHGAEEPGASTELILAAAGGVLSAVLKEEGRLAGHQEDPQLDLLPGS